MSGSRIARRQQRSHAKMKGRHDINVVPMLDIFVIMLFFLIFTAVLTPTRIIELNLPSLNSAPLDVPDQLVLEVVVRKDSIVVQDKNSGPIKDANGVLVGNIQNTSEGYDYSRLNTVLSQIKKSRPDNKTATLLLEEQIPYDTIISTMDAIRVIEANAATGVSRAELFPEISFGDAP